MRAKIILLIETQYETQRPKSKKFDVSQVTSKIIEKIAINDDKIASTDSGKLEVNYSGKKTKIFHKSELKN